MANAPARYTPPTLVRVFAQTISANARRSSHVLASPNITRGPRHQRPPATPSHAKHPRQHPPPRNLIR
eukprot:3203026-Lingulodinium_polyedra.AAC.1